MAAGESTTLTFTFNEAVQGFDEQDIFISSGVIERFTQHSDTQYVAHYRAEGAGDVAIQVQAGALTDLAGNALAEDAHATLRVAAKGATQVQIADATGAFEGEALVYQITLDQPSRAGQVLTLEATSQQSAVAAEVLSQTADPFAPGEYLANGTVFTRGVADMPLHEHSADIAAYAATLSAKHNCFGVNTSLNTTTYNIPIYIVDSADLAQHYAQFTSQDPRVIDSADIMQHTMGCIPFPAYGTPAGGGDKSFAVYDKATGMMREYFYAEKQADGSWSVRSAGYHQAPAGLDDLGAKNFWMQLDAGGSSVVMMLNPLSQIGISEALAGEIHHAVSVTLPDAKAGVASFPAKLSDGEDTHPFAPAEGQWFRLPPDLDLERLGLTPMTLMIAKAVQKYGGYGADRNLNNFAFNAESPENYLSQGKENPWRQGGEIAQRLGGEQLGSDGRGIDPLHMNDFPWHLVQWAPIGWNHSGADQGMYAETRIRVEVQGQTQWLAAEGGEIVLPEGVTQLTVSIPTHAHNQFVQTDQVMLTGHLLADGQTLSSAQATGAVADKPHAIAEVIHGTDQADVLVNPNIDPSHYAGLAGLQGDALFDYVREHGYVWLSQSDSKVSHTLKGGAGDDVFISGAGVDFLHGGAGADTFIFMMDGMNSIGYFAADRILDFNPQEGDRIVLTKGDNWHLATSSGHAEFDPAPEVQRLQY